MASLASNSFEWGKRTVSLWVSFASETEKGSLANSFVFLMEMCSSPFISTGFFHGMSGISRNLLLVHSWRRKDMTVVVYCEEDDKRHLEFKINNDFIEDWDERRRWKIETQDKRERKALAEKKETPLNFAYPFSLCLDSLRCFVMQYIKQCLIPLLLPCFSRLLTITRESKKYTMIVHHADTHMAWYTRVKDASGRAVFFPAKHVFYYTFSRFFAVLLLPE